MAKCRARRCKCGVNSGCSFDVCVTPMFGDPDYLTVLAPVVYDGIGINLCRQINLNVSLPTDYPTAVRATAQILNVTIPEGEVTAIPSKPNCFLVTLTNLTVNVAVNLYDCCNRLLKTLTYSPVYLPSDTTSPSYVYYDADTNPDKVEIEIFAPYGVAYTDGDVTKPTISYLGYTQTNGMANQGLILTAMPKVVNFDAADSTIALGITFCLQSVYYAPYEVSHNGKANYVKADLSTQDESACMDFVTGDLLEHSIKPLELGLPKCDEKG